MFKKIWNKITGKQEENQEILEMRQEEAVAEPQISTEFEMQFKPDISPEVEKTVEGKPTVETEVIAVKELQVAEEPELIKEQLTVEEPAMSEEPVITEEAQIVQEPRVIEEAMEVEETQPLSAVEIQPEAEILEQVETAETEQKKGFFKKLFAGLDKTRKNITDKIDNLINNYGKIDDELFEELEEILIMSDISMDTSMALISNLKEELIKRKISDAGLVKSTLRDVIVNFLNTEEEAKMPDTYPTIMLVIGVNGAGKTTTIGKLAHKYKSRGKSVILAAADTFRAAAIDQLQVWGERSGVRVIAHAEGSDPSAVIFDAINAAKSSKADILICDTAGRLHNKVNLMNELNKMFRIIEREYPEAKREVLIVLDATTGQNALNQAKLFKEVADITGLVLTKLDGAAKGGFVLSIKHDLQIPLKLIGVGEGIEDLQDFKPLSFANALMDIKEED